MNKYLWLDIQKLSRNILRNDQTLLHTKYFTARVTSPPGKVKRQGTFIEALQTLKDFSIFYGKYQNNPLRCHRCHQTYYVPNEKMTDVNIATELMTDAFQDKFDTAILVSADSDLTAPIKAVLSLFPKKRIVIAFPPNRVSLQLRRVASAYLTIGRNIIAQSQFPDQVTKPGGFILQRPPTWE